MNSPITNRIAAPLNYNGLPQRSYCRFSVADLADATFLFVVEKCDKMEWLESTINSLFTT
jgi:hypothetical protein